MKVVWWNIREDPAAQGYRPADHGTSVVVNLDVLQDSGQFSNNRVNWAPIVIETSPYRRLTQPGGAGSSMFTYGG
jgi:hypothetical protein